MLWAPHARFVQSVSSVSLCLALSLLYIPLDAGVMLFVPRGKVEL
jgi:hypothetical protein